MEAQSVSVTSQGAVEAWTCSRCEMTVSFSSEVESPTLPSSWTTQGDEHFCLNCRREMAGDEGVESLGEEAPNDVRQKARSQSRIEFEIRRVPDRPDNQIAKSCKTSTVAVRKARARMQLEPQQRI
jgi:hypothetical protein